MKKLAWIICPNGGGHIYRSERSFLLLKDFLISKNFKLQFWGPEPRSESFCNENFQVISKSENYTWPRYMIKNFKPSNFDLIISDNIIENKLGYFLKENRSAPFIFLSSFMWELIDNNYDKNQIKWIFNRLNYLFIYNKYFYNEKHIGNPKYFNTHGVTCDYKISNNKVKESILKIYITLGLRETINKEIIERINFIVENLEENIEVYVDKGLLKYVKNVQLLEHNQALSIANLIICRPGLGTLNQALGRGIKYYITCPEPDNNEMISNEIALSKIVNVKNIFDKNIITFIRSIAGESNDDIFLEKNGFEDINYSIQNYIKKNFS